jgi:hypothetical protein
MNVQTPIKPKLRRIAANATLCKAHYGRQIRDDFGGARRRDCKSVWAFLKNLIAPEILKPGRG